MKVTTIKHDEETKFIVELSSNEAAKITSFILGMSGVTGLAIAEMFRMIPIEILNQSIANTSAEFEDKPVSNLAIRLFQAHKNAQQTKEQ